MYGIQTRIESLYYFYAEVKETTNPTLINTKKAVTLSL